MKNKLVIGLITGTMLTSMPLNVYAVGSASINFNSPREVNVGDTVKVYMSIEDVKDAHKGIVGVGAELIYDEDKLEFIGAKTVDTPYDFWFNPKSNKLAGLDFTFEKAINKDTKIYEFSFKAIKEGTAKVTLDDAELSDSKTNVLETTVNACEIKIILKEENKESKEELNKNIENNSIETKEKIEIKEVMETKETISKKTIKNKEEVKVTEEITNKEKLEKVNEVVHSLIKKLSNLIK